MADKQLVISIITDAKKFTSGLTEAINTISKATEKAEGFEKYTEQLEVMKKELLEIAQQANKVEKATESGGEVVSQAQLTQLDSLISKVESIDKRFDSFRHTFGDMQDKLNGLSTRTLQAQLDKANASLDAFHQKYNSLQQTLNTGLNINKDFSQISNIGEMKAAYEDALKIYQSFSKEMQKDKNSDNYSKAYIDAAAAVYKYSSALMDLNDAYVQKNNKPILPEIDKIDEMSAITAEIIGSDLANKLYDTVSNFTDKVDMSTFFKEIQGKINEQTLTGALKNGGIVIPVKLDPNAYQNLLSQVKSNVDSLQSQASKKPIKIRYDTDTATLTKNIEKYFKELNTKLKNQVTELNKLMGNLVDNTGLKNTEQDFSSMAKLIPEMLRKVTDYSEQLKTITIDTKNSFENINSFTKEENFINYANAIKQTAESFKLLTSSLDDVSSKLSGNGLEGQFDILKKKFSELSIDTLTQEQTKENEQARKTKIKQIKELFALYSTYQSRGGIRPFSDLISGDADSNKRAYLQLAYNDYNKNKNKKGTNAEPVPFDAKQLKDILQILKDIRETIKNISEIKIDTSELTEAISAIQGNNSEKIFTPQAVSQIWQVLMQYANNYSESLSKVIEKLEIISEKDFEPLKLDSEEFERTYNQIENIVQLLEKGFGISLNPENQLKENIQDITEANQTATESNQKLTESMQEVAQAAQEEKEAVIDPAVFLKGGTPASKESQTQQQAQQTQQTIQQTNNEIENTDQSIITLVSDIKNALNSLSSDLNILAEIIVSLNNSTEQIDYSSRISNIRGGITTLNNSIKELVELVRKLDFDKINNIKISTEPFDKIIESLKEIIDLTERISGIPSKTSLDSQFKDIQKMYSSLVNDKGNFIVTKDKDAVQNLFSQYNRYKKFGGTKSLIDLDESKTNANKLSKYYDKYLNNISQQKESETSIINPLKNEAENFIGIKNAADEATVSKESFVKANKKLETQTDKTSKSLEQEKTQFETFINDVKTLVTTDIKSNNVVDFNTQILNSSKETNEVLKEELQYLQKLNEIQKNNPIKQNNTSAVSRNNLSKEQASKEKVSSFKKPNDEFDYEDLGLSYDPYINAFQEFLLIAAEESEKVKQQIISVAEFDNRLSEALTALYGQIPDLDDISASTGYGKNFNVTSATVSFRDKTTNDVYRKAFSLKKNKETGSFYIDQTTSILNDAEKYGKDNEKQAQQVRLWETQLNAWLQSFNNKTSGTLQNSSKFKTLENFKFTSSKDWIDIKGIQQELEGLYNEIVANSRKGTSSLSPVPNMMFNQENRLTKKQKAESVYNKMALKWNGGKGAEDTEGELKKLSNLYNNLQVEITKFNKDGSNIESVAQAYGAFNEQLNKVNEQLNRMKIVNTEINGNKINNLNNWFKDMPDPSSVEGKIDKYGQVYSQFVEAQQRLNELTTNLNKGTTEEDAQKYEEDKEKIHSIILELEGLKKILSSDSMNINNQMGKIIKQNIPETDDIEQIKEIVDEYAKAEGVITNSTYSTSIDKEGNQFVKFSREIKNAQGVVSEFEYTYDKAMGTIAVATKKVQEPESILKTLTDELTTKWRGLFTTLASFVGFYRLWGYFKQGIDTVREFDTALTEMQKVSDETISTLRSYQKETFNTADAIGATALQIQNSTADFMRLGESLKEASESAKVANVLMNVSEFQSIDEATKSLIAMSAAYDDLSKMNIIDKLNEVGLKIA